MKSFLFIFAGLMLSTNVYASNFSAFVHGNTLYMTILGDSCNSFHGGLTIAHSCKADRLTKNFALVCKAEATIAQTKMFCRDTQSVPVVVEIDLSKVNIAPEARVLDLTYGNSQIEVPLK